jgi:hypothetical protein
VHRPFPESRRKEFAFFKKLTTPAKVQDFLDTLPLNFEQETTCRSPLMVLEHKEAYCMEGAMLAAAIFWRQGRRPLILDLRTAMNDVDHVVALFEEHGLWGAVSKTNHAVLRYRDPIYRSIRELAVSYFNEYFLENGQKTLRTYSLPFDLSRFGTAWLTTEEPLWHIPEALDESRHFNILEPRMIRRLRPADPIEITSGEIVEWRKKKKRAGAGSNRATPARKG